MVTSKRGVSLQLERRWGRGEWPAKPTVACALPACPVYNGVVQREPYWKRKKGLRVDTVWREEEEGSFLLCTIRKIGFRRCEGGRGGRGGS